MIIVGLMVAGAVGAVLRFTVDRSVQRLARSDLPLGILVINVSGSLVLGILTGAAAHHGISPSELTVAGTGLIGAFTTFSTFSYDSTRLLEHREWSPFTLTAVLSVAGGLAAAGAGIALGSIT